MIYAVFACDDPAIHKWDAAIAPCRYILFFITTTIIFFRDRLNAHAS